MSPCSDPGAKAWKFRQAFRADFVAHLHQSSWLVDSRKCR
ncbi:hypothetical protein HMPREF9578_02167 [Cutibacterium acnes HL110PA4]|nr:hypothetical protein HMPREF9603_00498 [Cutibacterium acnes HL001PA1]EFT27210.1 hypothetical protein HMPREF9577_00180 [Cutibacterium acnes HL110PA3]EFT62636.1 hypothetical protein HMPREF9578_02167 [Cutibacterium acnes HL110PA4]